VCLYPTNANTLGLVMQAPTEGSATGEGITPATTTEEEEEQQEETTTIGVYLQHYHLSE
jgi:hypothetical protein